MSDLVLCGLAGVLDVLLDPRAFCPRDAGTPVLDLPDLVTRSFDLDLCGAPGLGVAGRGAAKVGAIPISEGEDAGCHLASWAERREGIARHARRKV